MDLLSTFGVFNLSNRILTVGVEIYTSGASRDWDPVDSTSLHIVDVSFIPNVSSKIVSSLQEKTKAENHITTGLQGLPTQDSKACRLYIIHGLVSNDAFGKHVEELISEEFSSFCTSPGLATRSALNRRLNSNQMTWWTSEMYIFGTPTLSSGLFAGLARCRIKLRCMWHDDGRMFCFLLCNSEVACYRDTRSRKGDTRAIHSLLTHLSNTIVGVESSYAENSPNITTRQMQQRIIMLRICHAVLLNHTSFLSSVEGLHSTFLQHLSDPGQTTITSPLLQVLSKDSYFWEQIHHVINIFVAAFESFLDAMFLLDNLPDLREFRELLIETRGLCTELNKTTESISSRLEGRLKFIEIGRSFHESSSLWLISLLAAIFLPLSLASSILSMQTRFVDLHYLLYDFFGVIFLLGTITITLAIVLKAISWGSEKLAARVTTAGRRNAIMWGFALLLVVPWNLTLASFLVGMIKDVGLGLRVLGYGFAAITGLTIILVCLVVLTFFIL